MGGGLRRVEALEECGSDTGEHFVRVEGRPCVGVEGEAHVLMAENVRGLADRLTEVRAKARERPSEAVERNVPDWPDAEPGEFDVGGSYGPREYVAAEVRRVRLRAGPRRDEAGPVAVVPG